MPGLGPAGLGWWVPDHWIPRRDMLQRQQLGLFEGGTRRRHQYNGRVDWTCRERILLRARLFGEQCWFQQEGMRTGRARLRQKTTE